MHFSPLKIIWWYLGSQIFSTQFVYSQGGDSVGAENKRKRDIPLIIFEGNLGLNPRKIPIEKINPSKFRSVPIIQIDHNPDKNRKISPLKISERTLEIKKRDWLDQLKNKSMERIIGNFTD